MKIVIIAGSHRINSESDRVANYIKKTFNSTSPQVEVEILSLSGNPIPLWEENTGTEEWKKTWAPFSEKLKSADGFIVISPEWNGMVPSGLRNLFLLCTKQELAHKPAMIVAVSSGVGGSYPITELRATSYKNTRICYIPEQIIIRQVGDMLKSDVPANAHDESIRKRIEYGIKILIEYTKALASVKSSPLLDYKSYPFGM